MAKDYFLDSEICGFCSGELDRLEAWESEIRDSFSEISDLLDSYASTLENNSETASVRKVEKMSLLFKDVVDEYSTTETKDARNAIKELELGVRLGYGRVSKMYGILD